MDEVRARIDGQPWSVLELEPVHPRRVLRQECDGGDGADHDGAGNKQQTDPRSGDLIATVEIRPEDTRQASEVSENMHTESCDPDDEASLVQEERESVARPLGDQRDAGREEGDGGCRDDRSQQP
jgi:hypothetical protein